MTRDKGDNEDGANEKMLGTDEKEQLARSPNEVKFIPSDHSNGDAKIDIGSIEKVCRLIYTMSRSVRRCGTLIDHVSIPLYFLFIHFPCDTC